MRAKELQKSIKAANIKYPFEIICDEAESGKICILRSVCNQWRLSIQLAMISITSSLKVSSKIEYSPGEPLSDT